MSDALLGACEIRSARWLRICGSLSALALPLLFPCNSIAKTAPGPNQLDASVAVDGGVFEDGGIDFEDFPLDDDFVYETVVTGKPPVEDGLSRTRISKAELARRGATTAAEIVEHEPAVFAQSDGKGERNFRLRGFDQRGVAVYLDGVPFTMPWGGAADLGKLPAEMVESVLLIKGPTSIVHGPGGMGGSLLIETRDPRRGPLVETEMEAGGANEGRLSLYHGQEIGSLAYAIGVGGSARDDYRLSSQYEPRRSTDGAPLENGDGLLENSDRDIRHGAVKALLSLPQGSTLFVQSFVVDGRFGIPRSTTDDRPYFVRFTEWRAIVVQAGHQLDLGELFLEEAFYAGFYDNRLDAYDDATYATQDDVNASISWYHDRVFGGRIRAEYGLRGFPWGRAYVRLWGGARRDIHRNQYKLGGDDNDLHEFQRTLINIVPEVEIPLPGKLTVLASLQTDIDIPDVVGGEYDEPDGADKTHETRTIFGPLMSLRYDPLEWLMLRVWAGQRNRIPTLSERFSSRIGFVRANPGLGHETALYMGLDASFELRDFLTVELSGFDAEVENLINAEYLPETNGVQQRQNVGRARFAGCEIAIDYRPWRQLGLTAAYAFLYARRRTDNEGEDRIAQIPAHQATFGVRGLPVEWIEVASYLRVIGPQAFDDYTILGLGELGAYALWDARLQVTPVPTISFWLKGTNLFDMNYQTKYGFPDRGIAGWLGVRFNID